MNQSLKFTLVGIIAVSSIVASTGLWFIALLTSA